MKNGVISVARTKGEHFLWIRSLSDPLVESGWPWAGLDGRGRAWAGLGGLGRAWAGVGRADRALAVVWWGLDEAMGCQGAARHWWSLGGGARAWAGIGGCGRAWAGLTAAWWGLDGVWVARALLDVGGVWVAMGGLGRAWAGVGGRGQGWQSPGSGQVGSRWGHRLPDDLYHDLYDPTITYTTSPWPIGPTMT